MCPVVINIFFLKINVIQDGSALNIGENHLTDWNSFSKTNAGTGSLYGDRGEMDSGDIFLQDPDLVDTPCQKDTFLNKIC
jgi:hypothetical protein